MLASFVLDESNVDLRADSLRAHLRGTWRRGRFGKEMETVESSSWAVILCDKRKRTNEIHLGDCKFSKCKWVSDTRY